MESGKLPVFLIFAQKFLKTGFNFFHWDENLLLTRECWEFIERVKKEFYFNFRYKNRKFYRLKRLLFENSYRKHPERYPDLIKKESFNISNFTQAVGGNPIDKNFIIGYFKRLTKPDSEEFFTNPFGQPVIPFSSSLEVVGKIIDYFVESSKLPDGSIPSHIIFLEKHGEDIKNLIELCKLISDLFEYSKKENLPFLRTGHIIGLVSSLNIYIDNLSRDLINKGMATISLENSPSIIGILKELKVSIESALKTMTIDILNSLILSMNYRIEIYNEKILLIDQNEYKKGIFDYLIDMILPEKYETPGETLLEKEVDKIRSVSNDLKIETKRHFVINSELFFQLFNLLKNFLKELKADLEPEFDASGKLVSLKQGFDQFDVSPDRRIIDPLRHTLGGRFSTKALLDFKTNNDEMVIKSTYWLYDRIKSILEDYRITLDGIELEKASEFVEEVRGLFFPSKSEFNEAKKYATFSYFKIYLERLFGSRMLQNKYHSMIKEILKVLDNCRLEVLKKVK